ncbi:MAG TPA: AmmeMemoRadiSam system protein B [Anaerolineales bacterium]|nr:AmmeMemoRadiSam system protein B [Anaerolineales bacterium]
MRVRRPVVAGQFYPADRAGCVRMIEECLPQRLPDGLPERIVAGVVPHAGWVYSGPTAAKVFAAIRSHSTPDTFVLLSAMHRWGAARPAVYTGEAWATPLGEAEVDADLAQAVLDEGAGLLVDAPEAHAGEHSAEVQVPFIQHLFPGARLLPILVPPDEQAVAAGEVIAQTIAGAGKNVVVVGTTDLTHYGAMYYGFAPAGTGERALEWARANDEQVINLMLEMQAEKIVPETAAHHNACGGGAIAATVAAARTLGAQKGVLLEYTTSHHVRGHGPATDFVGYAAVVF